MSYTHNSDAAVKEAVEFYEERVQEGRREFMRMVGMGAAATAIGGTAIFKVTSSIIGEANAATVGPAGWKSLFMINPAVNYMNVGSTGSTPTKIVKSYDGMTKAVAATPQSYWYWGTRGYREEIAPSFGCHPNELVMSFNTTDGLMRTFQGIDWKKDDVIITTTQEHPSGLAVIGYAENLYGAKVVTVDMVTGINNGEVPSSPELGIGFKMDKGEFATTTLLARFDKALAEAKKIGNPKMVFFSSPPFLGGVRLPEKEICLWAAEKNLISVIDGAHLTGANVLDLHDIGCDFFAGSGHKWQCGPGQTGFFYRRNGKKGDPAELGGFANPPYSNPNPVPMFWPTSESNIQSGAFVDGYCKNTDDAAGIIAGLGNSNYQNLTGLRDVCVLWDTIGRSNIEAYGVSLAQYLRCKAGQSVAINNGGAGGTVVNSPNSMAVEYRKADGTAWSAFDSDMPTYIRSAMTGFSPIWMDGVAGNKADYNVNLDGPASTTATTTVRTGKCQGFINAGGAITGKAGGSGIQIRTRSVSQQYRDTPGKSAYRFDFAGYLGFSSDIKNTSTTSLRITTHLFNTMAEVDKLMAVFEDPANKDMFKATAV